MGAGIQTFGINKPFLNYDSARGFYAFFFGLILAEILRNKELGTKHSIISLLIMISIVLLIIYQPALMNPGINYTMTFIFYPSLIIFCKSKPMNTVVNHPMFGLLGKISFDVFIWHSALLLSTNVLIKENVLQIDVSNYTTMFVFVVICYAIGAVSYYLIEKPLNRKINEIVLEKGWISDR